jgi:hypothetical protein
MNVGKTKVIRISRQPFPVKLLIDQNKLENVESSKYLGSMLTVKQNVLVKLNPRLVWQKMHLTRTGLFLLVKWTSN